MCFIAGCYCLFLYCVVNHGSLSSFVYTKSFMGERYLYGYIYCFLVLIRRIVFLDFFLF